MNKLMFLASGILLLRLLDVRKLFVLNCFAPFYFLSMLRNALRRAAAFFCPAFI
jgi:hypothetical protein